MSGAQRGFDTAENRRPRIQHVPAKPSPMPRAQSMDGADSPGAASPRGVILTGPSRPADREPTVVLNEPKKLFQVTGGILDDQFAPAFAHPVAGIDDRFDP